MIVSSDLFIYIFGGIAIVVGLLYILVNGIKSWRGAIFPGVLAGALVAGLLQLPTKDIHVVLDNHNVNSYLVYGSPDILTSGGITLSLDEYNTTIGCKYLFNLSHSDMVVYPVKYGNPGIFNRKGSELTAPLLIEAGEYYKLKDNPSYWFKEAPKSISRSENALIVLWEKIFGSFDIIWIVDDFNVNNY